MAGITSAAGTPRERKRVCWQHLGLDDLALDEGTGTFDEILELAHIARIVVFEQTRRRFLGKVQRASLGLGETGEKLVGQRQDVLAPIAQRGNLHVNHVESVEKVLAKTSGLNLVGQVAIGGRDEAGVDLLKSWVLPTGRALRPGLPAGA